jgi:outer membrane protein TolC
MGATRNTTMNFAIRYMRLFIGFVLTGMLIMTAKPGEAAGISAAVDAPVDLSDGISAQEAVALAIRNNYRQLSLGKAREAALGEVSRAKAFSEPEIRFGTSGLDDSRIKSQGVTYNLEFQWTPPRLGERGLKGDRAMGKVYETEGAIAVEQHDLAAKILSLHAQIVFLDEKIALAEAAVKLRETILEFVDSQVKAQLKTLLDRNIADLALADARLIPENYRANRLVYLNQLAVELNLSAADLKIQKEPDALVLKPLLLDLPSLIDAALVNRHELSITSARIAEAENTLSLNKKERYPWFSAIRTGPEFDTDHSSRSWRFLVEVEIPVFKWNNGYLRTPAAEVQQSQADLADLKKQIRMQVEKAATQLQAHYKALEQIDKTIVPILSRELTLAEESMKLGQADRMQYLLAQAQGLQRRQSYLTDLLEYRRLEIELDRVTGNILLKNKKDMKAESKGDSK